MKFIHPLYRWNTRNILPHHGEVLYFPAFYSSAQARAIYHELLEGPNWQQQIIKGIPLPRLTAWHSFESFHYYYNGIENQPTPLTPCLERIMRDLGQFIGIHFNGVLANYYPNGDSAIHFHRGQEASLIPETPIVSLSFGQSRQMLFKSHRYGKGKKYPIRRRLNNGDLLIQDNESNQNWSHAIKKSPSCSGSRINLTFRLVREIKDPLCY